MQDLNLIRKIAWSFAKSTGYEFDDLFSEACIAYVKAVRSHNSDKAKLSTWATLIIKNHLIDYCNKGKKEIDYTISDMDEYNSIYLNQEKSYMLKQYFKDLPKDLNLICKVIFESPNEILANSPRASRGKLAKKLRSLGWSWPRIRKGIKNMRTLINKKPLSITM